MTFVTGKQIQLTAKLNPTDTTLTADVDIGVTNGRFYFVNDMQEEWVSFTGVSANGSYFDYTGLTRGLSQTANPATSGTGSTWIAGSIGYGVAMHDQLPDTKADNTFTGTNTFQQINATDIRFTGTTTSGLRIKSLTTAQRLALTPSNGDLVYDSTIGELYQYISGAWSAVSSGSTQPNASTTVAGKVETATTPESIAGTDVGGTGANLFVLPSDIASNQQSNTFSYTTSSTGSDTYTASLTPTLTTYTTGMRVTIKFTTANTGACSINLNSLGAKSIKTIFGNDPADGDIVAGSTREFIYDGTNFVMLQPTISSSVEAGLSKRATNAEVVTGTNDTGFVTPKTLKDNYGFITIPTVLGSDQTTSSTTSSDITGFSTSLATSSKYYYKMFIVYQQSNTTTGVGFFPSYAGTSSIHTYKMQIETSEYSSNQDVRSTLTVGLTSTNNTAGTNYITVIEGFIITTSSNTLVGRFRIGTGGGGGTLTVKAGSFIELIKIA